MQIFAEKSKKSLKSVFAKKVELKQRLETKVCGKLESEYVKKIGPRLFYWIDKKIG